ncbi:hypothetical protein BDY19DRAFT_865903, partial [Irpex rosettiformis]
FIKCAAALREDIFLTQAGQHPIDKPPDFLSRSLAYFLSQVSGLGEEDVQRCWRMLKDIIWEGEVPCGIDADLLNEFKQYGHNIGLTLHTFHPPSTKCIVTTCTNKSMLTRASQISGVLHTLEKGSVQMSAVQFYCPVCRTVYHHDHYVSNGRRIYYPGVPSAIQVSTHRFAEVRLIQTWIYAMLFAWTSASNCARLYNTTLAELSHGTDQLPVSPFLQTNEVWDSFTLLCLLEDRQKNSTVLNLPHHGLQEHRFDQAMEERNERIQANGLPDVCHYCLKCTRMYDDRKGGLGILSAVVIDGITIGHPCCGHHNCHNPLPNHRARFCNAHASDDLICCVTTCTAPVVTGSRVCSNTDHIAIQTTHFDRGQARFQLQRLLTEARAVPTDSDSLPDVMEVGEKEFEIDPEWRVRLEGTGSTESDTLIVCPCGVIIARATFYGAEAIRTVIEFIMQVYRNIPRPDHIIFDNNCQLARAVRNEPFFDNIGLSVDVFHFKCKRSMTDKFCQENCNPRAFPELVSEDGGWYFNSSIAEQTNVWLGGFHSICREMHVLKYNFFLDEMVMRRNRLTLSKLEAGGYRPMYWN